MNDGLISRVKRLVTGSVHGLVDSIESAAPETVMREAIREIDEAANEVRTQLGRTIANRHHASKRLMDATSKHEELAENARFAIEQGRDDLAEAAVTRQIDLEAQMPVLEASLSELSSEQAELEGYVAALLARKREMETDLDIFLSSRASDVDTDGHGGAPTAVNRGMAADRRAANAEDAFNRVLQGASGVQATTRADRETAVRLGELETITREHRVRERLADLKRG